jgi:hypothetical protein
MARLLDPLGLVQGGRHQQDGRLPGFEVGPLRSWSHALAQASGRISSSKEASLIGGQSRLGLLGQQTFDDGAQ